MGLRKKQPMPRGEAIRGRVEILAQADVFDFCAL